MGKLMRDQAIKKGKMFKLPKSWTVKQIKETLDLESGVWGKEKEKGYPVLRSTNFSESGYIDFEEVTYRDIPERKIEDKKLIKGDVLLEISGGGPQQPVGRVVYFDKNKSEDYLFGNFVKRLRLKKDLSTNNDPYYIFRFLERYYNIGQTETLQHQTTGIRNLDYRAYMSLPLPLPPLPEQKKIASILSSVDKAIEKTDQVIEKTKELKKGLMQKLLTKGIGHSEFKDSQFGKIPKNWNIQPLNEVAEITGGNTPRRSNEKYWGGDIPWLTPSQLTGKIINEISKTDEYMTNKGFENSSVKLLPAGTVMLTSRATIGETVINKVPMTTNQGFANIICDDKKLFNYYILYLLRYLTPKLEALAGGSTFLEISRTSVRSLNIPVPPLKEQKKIASILSSVDKKIEKEQQYKEKLERLKKGLMQKLLTGEVRVNVNQEV